ncbi:MAG: hypothetical protein K0Q92_753 [Steroidobacteraceae bacterium]|nr:hypothetical protein [Steroidobacteraceae bacterium]
MADEDLLRPSLSDTANSPALYNSTGFFLSAFFAGPAAAGVYGLANSHRLGRLRQDLPTIVALVAGSFLLWLVAHRQGWVASLADLMGDRVTRATQLAVRLLGLACFAAIYLLHRQHYRAAQVSGVDSLSGWAPGIAAVVVGLLANGSFAAWMARGN